EDLWSMHVVNAIVAAPPGVRSADLAALRDLLQGADKRMVHAAALRAATMAEEGRALAALAIERSLLTVDDAAVSLFAALALQADVRPADVSVAIVRLRAAAHGAMLADAFAVPFLRADLRGVAASYRVPVFHL